MSRRVKQRLFDDEIKWICVKFIDDGVYHVTELHNSNIDAGSNAQIGTTVLARYSDGKLYKAEIIEISDDKDVCIKMKISKKGAAEPKKKKTIKKASTMESKGPEIKKTIKKASTMESKGPEIKKTIKKASTMESKGPEIKIQQKKSTKKKRQVNPESVFESAAKKVHRQMLVDMGLQIPIAFKEAETPSKTLVMTTSPDLITSPDLTTSPPVLTILTPVQTTSPDLTTSPPVLTILTPVQTTSPVLTILTPVQTTSPGLTTSPVLTTSPDLTTSPVQTNSPDLRSSPPVLTILTPVQTTSPDLATSSVTAASLATPLAPTPGSVNAKGYTVQGGKAPKCWKKSCLEVRSHVEVLESRIAELEKALETYQRKEKVDAVQIPRAGKVVDIAVAQKYMMIELAPSSGVFIHQDQYHDVIARTDGKKQIRFLLGILLSKEELILTLGQLDAVVMNAAIAFALQNSAKGTCTRTQIVQTIHRKLAAFRAKGKKKIIIA